MTLKIGAVLVLVGLCPHPLFAQDPVDRYIQQQMARYRIPGLSLAVVRHGSVIKLKAYGRASVEFDVPVTPESVFQTYSVTKILAGVAVLKLVEDGKVLLETSVTEVIQTLPPAWSGITIRHLLAHTSGLPEVSDNPRFAALSDEQKGAVTTEQMLTFAAEAPLRARPGEKAAYHRFGYTLLGVLVERIAQQPFADFLRERVLTPLGMASTRFGDVETVIEQRATAYNRSAGDLRVWQYTFGFGNPGAGLNSSAADLARLMSSLDGTRLLTRESLATMWRPVALNDGTPQGYALGWTTGVRDGRRVVGHEGGGAAWVTHFPDDRLSVVILSNLNGARADAMQYEIAKMYLTPRPPQ